MKNFFLQSYYSYRALFLWLNWWGYVSNVFFRPMLFMSIYAITGRFAGDQLAADRYAVGWIALAGPFIVIGGLVQSFSYERSFGTLGIVFASDGTRVTSFFSRSLLHAVNGLLSSATALVFAWLVLGVDFSQAAWGGVLLSILTITISISAFSLFIGSFSIVLRDWFFVVAAGTAVVLLLSGALIPRDGLPPGFAEVGLLAPTTHGTEALRGAVAGSGDISGALAKELLLAVIYAFAAQWLFRSLETAARRDGAYETI